MERGAATKGKMARAMAGADNIEIKATIPHHQITAALKRFKLTADNDEERFIYFFDTPALDLLKAGIITRARRVVGDAHDSTVKFRPIDPGKVGNKWRKFPDFKIEADASETSFVKSASFSMPVQKGHIKRVVANEKPIAAIFTPEQRKFIQSTANHKIDFESLVALGPLLAQRWKFQDPGCPWPITAELWKRDDGERLMEMSIKAPSAQAAAAMGGFMAFLAEVGAERDKGQLTKTRWALDHYASKLPGKAVANPRPGVSAVEKPKTSAKGHRARRGAKKGKAPAGRRPAAKKRS
jgi:hypothetical protein